MVKVRVSGLASWGAATSRGQRPNAERMVSGVLWIRVDLGLCIEDEPHLTRLIDDIGFRDVTGSGAWVRTLGGSDSLLVQAAGQWRSEPTEIARDFDVFSRVGHNVGRCGQT